MLCKLLNFSRVLYGCGRCHIQNLIPEPCISNFVSGIVKKNIDISKNGNRFRISALKEYKSVLPIFRRSSLVYLLCSEIKNVKLKLKESTIIITKNCISQFEFVLAYRIRRAQQVISLYLKLWDENALKLLIFRIRRQLFQKGRAFLLGSAGASVYCWEKERIEDKELLSHVNEFEVCNLLHQGHHAKIENAELNSKYCLTCGDDGDCWEPFISRQNLMVWKREPSNMKGSQLYCYKMHGSYCDVRALDFLEAFLDVTDRKTWDDTVVDLHVVEAEPCTNSEVIYWETKWPTLFQNRDYVFTRRYKVLKSENLVVICNKSTRHPDYPVNPNKTRVSQYWSYLVIKPITSFEKPGIEFSLTYFDNPGASLPNSLSLWISSTGMPEYLGKLHVAAVEMSKKTFLSHSQAFEKEPQHSEELFAEKNVHEETYKENVVKIEKTVFSEAQVPSFSSTLFQDWDDFVIYQMLIS